MFVWVIRVMHEEQTPIGLQRAVSLLEKDQLARVAMRRLNAHDNILWID